jgi:Tol biopolymer transport system component
MKRITILFIFNVCLFSVPQATAQFYNGLQMVFGKNRVQYSTEKIWSHYRFEKFDTYFYQNGKELAINTAKYSESILPVLQSKLDFYLTSKLQFIIFNSMSDMKESNIGLADENSYNIGGVTQVIGSTVILYFNGSYTEFEAQIRNGIATVLVNQMVYGEELGANIKNSALLFLPDWYVKGLVSYVSDDWNTTLDNIARNGFISGKFFRFNNLTGDDAVIAGHSIWKYLRDVYGEKAVANVVYLTKITRSLESGFLYYTGMSFRNFTRDWYQYYTEIYRTDVTDRVKPPEEFRISLRLKNDAVLQNLAISPDGRYFAYSVDRLNQKSIYLVQTQHNKRQRIYRTGYRIDDKTDLSYPLLAWHPRSDLLAFLIEKKGIIHLFYYFPETGTLERQSVFGVDKIHDMNFSPNGISLLVSATINGQSDIFLYQLASKTFERITKDIYDDLNPVFVHNGNYIAFASNRLSDTITFDKDTYIRDYAFTPEKSLHFNIFLYNYVTKSPVLWRITDLNNGNAIHPMPYEYSSIQFLSDINGIQNRYLAHIDSTISYVDTIVHYRYFATVGPVTDYPASIMSHDLSFTGETISEIVYEQNKWNVNFIPKKHISVIEPPAKTFYLKEPAYADTSDVLIIKPDTSVIRQSYPISPDDTSKVNINNYVFKGYRKTSETDASKQDSLSETKDTLPTFVLPYQRNYDVEYSINQLVSQLDYSFLNVSYQPFLGGGPIFLGPGLNAFFKIGINDLMEDYRIVGGVRLSFNLRNNEYFLGFENYKGRLDKKWIFHRQGYDLLSTSSLIVHKQNNLHYILQYPFNNVFALRTSFMARQDKASYLAIDYQNLIKPGQNELWGGVKTELVFDNTRNPQLNIYYGQRWKIWAEYFQLVAKEQKNLFVLGFDYRNYTKIHKNFIFANRIAGSTTNGNSKLIYYLGGVDNWLVPRFNYDVNISYDRNYKFQALATNMRGFEQNIRNGNSFVVANSELRLPVFSYFINRPIRSEFIKNFQIVAFGDMGTAWEGWDPFSEDNSLFTHVIQTNSLTIIVRRQKNPLVGGFGTGLRTKLFGYFVKSDLAWGVEDGKVKKPLLYVSFSLDF